eukprot:TRINITY_DN11116_c0_g1_i1.p1 TRINITY_DN11116_c0_g1~~TRINITY_DN11116_c0_g1_i1.p1  ORF type:complete len:578 (-),score=28.40 TRINITY_DN11116_c0_g1_i1:254-1987(-)
MYHENIFDGDQSTFVLLNDLMDCLNHIIGGTAFWNLYVVGGWVRDKLVCSMFPQQSSCVGGDVDLLITGIDLQLLYELTQKYVACGIDEDKRKLKGFNFWKKNPQKFKFQDIFMMKINEIQLEITTPRQLPSNVRSSIVSTDEFRKLTADQQILFEDACCRDFTINCMFYDIKNRQILDFVGGKEHLNSNILDTPCNYRSSLDESSGGPYIDDPSVSVTFESDPLRVLRSLRFLSKFPHLRLSSRVENYLTKSTHIKKYLSCSSKERIKEELNKIILTKGREIAFTYIFQKLDLCSILFPTQSGSSEELEWSKDVKDKSTFLISLFSRIISGDLSHVCDKENNVIGYPIKLDGSDMFRLFVALSLFPFTIKSSSPSPITKWLMREVWRYDSAAVDEISLYLAGYPQMLNGDDHSLYSEDINPSDLMSNIKIKVIIGRMLRSIGESIKNSTSDPSSKFLIHYLLGYFIKRLRSNSSMEDIQSFCFKSWISNQILFKTIVEQWRFISSSDNELGDPPIWRWKHIFTAKELITRFKVSGKEVSKLTYKLMEWQIIVGENGYSVDEVAKERLMNDFLTWKN